MVENTLIYPVIRTDLLEQSLKTLYRHTPDNFYVYVIDNSLNGIDKSLYKYIHHYIKPYRNLGFAKSFNTGLSLVETPYVTTCNDDVAFINYRWWEGVLKTFDKVDKATPDRPCLLVTPSSVKLPDWSVGRPSGDHFYIKEYKEFYTEEDYDSLLNEEHYVNEHLTIRPDTVIDGVTLYSSIMRTDLIRKIGGLSERYYAGGGEDYSLCCRANMLGYRSVGTTLSWVYHHWSSSLGMINEFEKQQLIDPARVWNKTNEEFGGGTFDIWGLRCPICEKTMTTDPTKTFVRCEEHDYQIDIVPPSKVDL